MNIAVRLFLGYFLVVGLAAWFVLTTFSREVEPGVRQATEDTLVDTANLLAEVASAQAVSAWTADGNFGRAVNRALQREPEALISGVNKDTVELRVYLTDAHGIVLFDSAKRAVGADYSKWHDVARVLHGQYGARSTRERSEDPDSTVMYVAAPVMRDGVLAGVLTVAKPVAALAPYTSRARDRVLRAGYAMLALSALIGLAFTGWLTWSLNRLRNYARALADGVREKAPILGGRQLSELARALAHMRERLDGKQYVEAYVQNLAHELKSPLSAVRASAELLGEGPAEPDARRFVRHIGEQAQRMQAIIERLLQLARVEQLQVPDRVEGVDLHELAASALRQHAAAMDRRRLTARVEGEAARPVRGDRFLLEQALGNLVDNAVQFSPEGGEVRVLMAQGATNCQLSVRDQGPGAPDYALARLFEKFYSLPRPDGSPKGTGLGLAFVREVAKLHGGTVAFHNLPGGGAQVDLTLAC